MDTTVFEEMLAGWPSALVARTEVETFSGGLMSEKYQSNLDSAGLGPKGRIRIGRKIAYPVKPYVAWLAARSSAVKDRDQTIEE